MTNSAPVAYADSLLTKNKTNVEISLGAAPRRIGMGAMESSVTPWLIGVCTRPGWIEFTRMPCGASSTAADLVMPRRPNLAAT